MMFNILYTFIRRTTLSILARDLSLHILIIDGTIDFFASFECNIDVCVAIDFGTAQFREERDVKELNRMT